jgi:hypothetical protein
MLETSYLLRGILVGFVGKEIVAIDGEAEKAFFLWVEGRGWLVLGLWVTEEIEPMMAIVGTYFGEENKI